MAPETQHLCLIVLIGLDRMLKVTISLRVPWRTGKRGAERYGSARRISSRDNPLAATKNIRGFEWRSSCAQVDEGAHRGALVGTLKNTEGGGMGFPLSRAARKTRIP